MRARIEIVADGEPTAQRIVTAIEELEWPDRRVEASSRYTWSGRVHVTVIIKGVDDAETV